LIDRNIEIKIGIELNNKISDIIKFVLLCSLIKLVLFASGFVFICFCKDFLLFGIVCTELGSEHKHANSPF
jgi:hypothetical protein